MPVWTRFRFVVLYVLDALAVFNAWVCVCVYVCILTTHLKVIIF